ncbi:MAG: hypothetical protein GWN97_05835 [Thermoplasmata archaeon]|nr:hypothetical protein [Thermoplasmata archaeon]
MDAGSCVTCGYCVDSCGEDAITLTIEGPLVSPSRDDLVLDGGPPYPAPPGPPPSRLFRMAVDREGQREVVPEDLLRNRSGALLGPEDGG